MFFPVHVLVSRRRVLRRHIARLICLTVLALESVELAAAVSPPVQPVPEGALLALAKKKFGTLSRVEEELFRATQEGRTASVRSKDEKENDPANAANWPAVRVVRAECIRWICTDPQASVFVTYDGLALYGMRIDGQLNLANADLKFPFQASKCAFLGDISLQDAQTRGFYLLDCQIKGLNAERATIKGSVYLRGKGFKAKGKINLMAATIGGDLDCSSAELLGAENLALRASGATIQGNVYLRDGFKAEGEVSLVDATIGGGLDCGGGQFSNPKGEALMIEGARIRSGVFLRNGFKAEGEVSLVGATIGGLDCIGGQFINPNGLALVIQAAKIEGGVLMRDGFKAEGEVNVLGAAIGVSLDCGGGQFINPNGSALVIESSRIEGTVYLRGEFRARGEVSLVGTTVGNLQIREVREADQMKLDLRLAKVESFWDDEKSWPKAGNLFLDGFRYERLAEGASFDAESRKKWLSLQPRDKFRPQPYEQLAAVLRDMGHEREAREVMIEKNRERARFTNFPQQAWWWHNIFGRFIGYGYAPWRAFAMSLAMIALGTILFCLGSTRDLISPTSENAYAKAPDGQVIEENGRPKISETYPVFNAFFYSLESFTPLLKLDQSAHWRPNANHGMEISPFPFGIARTGSLLRYYLYFHIAAGWVLTSLWVGAITGLVKT